MRELTIEEANALVPELHRVVSAQMLLQDEIATEIGMGRNDVVALRAEFKEHLAVLRALPRER